MRPDASRGAARAVQPSRTRVALRLARGVGLGLLWTIVFSVALIVSLLLHADTSALRSAIASAINQNLSDAYRGRVEVAEIERLGAFGAATPEIRVLGEHGEPLLSLRGVKLRYSPLQLLSALLGASGQTLTLEHVRVDESRLVLALDAATGEWSLLRALSKRPKAKPPTQKRVPLVYAFSAIELGRVELSFDHPSFGKFDARIDHLQGSASFGGSDSSVSVERFGVRLIAGDGSSLDGTGSFRLLPKGYLAGAFHGFLNGTEVDAAGQWDEGVLTLRLGIPLALPERMRRWLPEWPLEVPLIAELEAHGPPDACAIEGRLRAQQSTLDVTGVAHLTAPASLSLELTAAALDSTLFWPAAPRLRLDARARAMVQFAPTGATLTLDAQTEPTTFRGVPLPNTTLQLRTKGPQLELDLHAADTRGRVDARLERGADASAKLTAELQDVNLSAFRQLGSRGSLDGRLQATLASGALSGKIDASARGLAVGSVRVDRARAKGNLEARLDAFDAARLETTLTASGIDLGPLHFETGDLTSRGTPFSSRFEAKLARTDGNGKLAGTVELRPELSLENVDAAWSASGLTLSARAGRVRPAHDELRAVSLDLSGSAGRLRGSGDLAPGRIRATLDAEALDIAALARAFGKNSERVAARVSGHVELSDGAGKSAGVIDVVAKDVGVRDMTIGSLDIDAKLDGTQVDAEIASSNSPFGTLQLTSQLDLAGSALALSSWQRATGQGSIKLERVPLWPIGLVVARHTRIKDLDGQLQATLQVERSDARTLPNLFLQAGTSELQFAVGSENASSDVRVGHFDRYAVHTSASVDGSSGNGVATVVVTDESGALVTTSGSIELELRALIASPETILERLVQAPLDALIRLHPRPLSALPPPFGVRDLSGSVDALLQLRGSLADPTLSFTARGHQLLGAFSDGERAVDLTSSFDYAPITGRLSGNADVTQAGQRLVTARLEGRLPNPLSHENALRDAEFRAAAMLNGVPLELWPTAARNELVAKLYGSVDIERRDQRFQERAHIEMGELSVAGHPLGNGRLTFQDREDQVRAELWLGARQRELTARVTALARETPESLRAFEGTVSATDFDAASLTPLVKDVLSRVSGDMDAELKFALRKLPNADEWYLGIDGEARLEHGGAHLDLFGLELREIAANLRTRSTPEYTVIQIEPLTAKSRARNPNLQGDAELWLRGLRLVNGEANLSLEDVPLSLEGATRGTARGHLRARVERQPDHMALEIKIPDLRVKLPTSSTRSLIGLDPSSDVHVLQAAESAERRSTDALLWKISFDLGEDVRIQRVDLDVPITGRPKLEYRDALRPSGTIEVASGGHVELFDQTFNIDRGIAEFIPDRPNDPRIDLTASWRAPDGTSVYVDVTGTAKHPSVLTRDDRGLEDVERFYLVTGSARSDDGSGDDAALGQTFAFGVNQLLRESLGNVSVSVGKTRDDRASYSASVRLTDKLTFQGNFQPASEGNLEQSTNDLTGTLDYRFTRRWSLRTELGTSGGAFDLLWSHRY